MRSKQDLEVFNVRASPRGFMSQPSQRPELAGVKVKKRKKDLKSKFEPEEFCEALIEEIKDAEGNLDAVTKKLDASVDTLDFKRYAEVLFDVLFTGGMLDAGGEHAEGVELSLVYLFLQDDDPAAIKKYVEIFNLLIRRYRYLQKGFEDSITKMLRFLNRFERSESSKLAMACTYFFISQMAPTSLLTVLFMDHLVKEGHSLQFLTTIFKTFLLEQSIDQLISLLKKGGLDDRLLEFFPFNKRTDEFFSRHFNSEGLGELVAYYDKRSVLKSKTEFKDNVQRMITEHAPLSETIDFIKQQKNSIGDSEIIPLVWEAVMGAVEWSRRSEQIEEQALKAAKDGSKLLATVVNNAKTELTLLLTLQNYCYEDPRLTKMFSKFASLFYKLDILSETAIVYWYNKGASTKGKGVFLQQMEPFINWLNEAEEESDDNQ